MGCTNLLRRGVGAPHQCSLELVASKLPLPFYADLRLHVPMTHRDDAGTTPPVKKRWLFGCCTLDTTMLLNEQSTTS